jgi:hypothetical protein
MSDRPRAASHRINRARQRTIAYKKQGKLWQRG